MSSGPLLSLQALQVFGLAVLLAQANDVIGIRPIPGARNEIVKLLLRHTKM